MTDQGKRTRRPKRPVDGVLLLDKPRGLTSNHALQQARRAFNAAKAGHTGTLDPMATGLLPLAFGEATKFSQMLLNADKTYEAFAVIGAMTTTGDAEGEVVRESVERPSEAMIREVVTRFLGPIQQMPPMYSALKRDGKPLYEYARAGIELERPTREVTIHELEVTEVQRDGFFFRVRCSKGTYVRTLAEDIGLALGTLAHLGALRRSGIGPFSVVDAISLDTVNATPEAERDQLLMAPDALAAGLPRLDLDAGAGHALLHGQGVALQAATREGDYRLYFDERFIGVGAVQAGRLRSTRLVATG